MNYTRGKWNVSVKNTCYEIHNGEYTIAETYLCKDLYSEKEDEANAKLIAKAPEMYQALKGLYDSAITTVGDQVIIRTNTDTLIKLESLLNEIES